MKGISGRGYRAPFTRSVEQTVSASFDIQPSRARARRRERAARQGCQRLGPWARSGEENAPKREISRTRRSGSRRRETPVPRTRARRKPCDESGTHEARVLVVESVGKQMSVRRIARSVP